MKIFQLQLVLEYFSEPVRVCLMAELIEESDLILPSKTVLLVGNIHLAN